MRQYCSHSVLHKTLFCKLNPESLRVSNGIYNSDNNFAHQYGKIKHYNLNEVKL